MVKKKKEEQKISSRLTKFIGKIVANSYYDMQEIRISAKNRIRDVIRKKIEGIEFDEVEDKKSDRSFDKKYTDKQLFDLWEKLKEDKKISQDEYEYVKKCWNISESTEKIENEYEKAMLDYIKTEKVYNEFLTHIRGIGPVLSANLIKEFGDCSQYDTPAKLWAHTGNAVIGGIAPKKRKGEEIHFNPKLRTMTWKISDCLLKSNKGIYRQIYDTEKQKQTNRIFNVGELVGKYGSPYKEADTHLSKLHAHNMALRKMRKIFLANYWEAARELNGLDTKEPFAKEKLGHENIITWRRAIKNETAGRG